MGKLPTLRLGSLFVANYGRFCNRSPKPWLTPNNRGKLPLHLLLLPDSIPQGQKNHVHRPISTPTLRLLLKHDAAEQIAIRADPADPATDAFGLACRRIAADELDENAVACLKTLLTLGGKVRDPVAERVCRDLLTVEWADSSVKDGLSVALVEWEAFREQEKANEPEAVEEKAEKKLPAVAEIKRRRFVRVSSTFAKGAKRMAVEEEEDLGHAAEAVKPEFDDDVISLPSTDRGTPKIEQGDEIGVVGMSTEGFARQVYSYFRKGQPR